MINIPAASIKPFGFLGIPILLIWQDNPPPASPPPSGSDWDYIDIALVNDPNDDMFYIVRDTAQRDEPQS